MKKLLFAIIWCTASLYAIAKQQPNQLPIVTISEQELMSGGKAFDEKLCQAACHGFFYVEIPTNAQPLISAAKQFANTFYKDEHFKTIELPGYSGYVNHDNVQAESFYCEGNLWQKVYPESVAQLAVYMKSFSERILQKVLSSVLPQLAIEQLNEATGGLYDGGGLYHLSFKHYRPEMKKIGLPPHRDFGYLTILFIEQKGLYAKINDVWHAIPPNPGHFIVNFGKALEILVNDPNKLKASWHYVEQIAPAKHRGDRINFGLFGDSCLATPVYKVTKDNLLEVVYKSYKEYVDASFKDVYDAPDLLDIA